jgi:anhydro-N-acetylmuramic acid kinase
MLLFSIVRSRPVAYSPNRRMRVLGCMSGTSVDGIDVACADLELADDELRCQYLGLASTPFHSQLRERIVAAMPPGLPGAGELCQLHAELGHAYAAAFVAARDDLAGGQADLAVLHGQTFYHWVDDTGRALGTLQLGNSSTVAEHLGVPVISDLRSRDVAAGGQGAPLVSMFDALLLAGRTRPSVAVNLGGIANLTVVDGGEVVTAYDLGPAGALIDPAAARSGSETVCYDADGAMAKRGHVCEQLLERLKADTYYRLPPPRSTGREHFNAGYLQKMLAGLDPVPADEDVVATVTRLVVDLLADASRHHRVAELVLSGGGSKNATIVGWLRSELPEVTVRTTDELGIPVQAKEALAFAVLGYLTWNGRPGSVTAATGARHQSILGSIEPGAGPLVLPPPMESSPSRLRLCH